MGCVGSYSSVWEANRVRRASEGYGGEEGEPDRSSPLGSASPGGRGVGRAWNALDEVILGLTRGVRIGECMTTLGGRGGEPAAVEAAGGDAEADGAWRKGSMHGRRL